MKTEMHPAVLGTTLVLVLPTVRSFLVAATHQEFLLFRSSNMPTDVDAGSTIPPTSSSSNNQSSLTGCVNMALSVDGFISGKDGDMDWLNNHPPPTNNNNNNYSFTEFLAGIDIMIMGRNTFDTVVGFGQDIWPYGELPIVIWTRNIDQVQIPEWIREKKSVTPRSAPSPETLWRDLERDGRYNRVYIDGGMTVMLFLKAGLIHELSLTIVPILLGDGTPLFSGHNDNTTQKLKLISTKSYDNGMITSKYSIVHDV
jgi:dihydrofolate reductase